MSSITPLWKLASLPYRGEFGIGEAVLEEELDYWAYVLVHFVRSRGFLLDARLAKVWLCGNMTGIVKDVLII